MALARSKVKQIKKGGQIDFMFAMLLAALILIGLTMISSASIVMSRTVAGQDNFYFFSQLKSAALGLFLLLVALKIDYRFWKKVSPYILAINIIFLIIVFIPGLGFHHGGANRWVVIGPINFQPSEIIKLSLVLYLASWFENKGNEVRNFVTGTLPFLAILGTVAFLVMKQPDMGTTSVLAVTSGVMFFVAGANYLHVGAMVSAGIAGLFLLIKTAPYRMARLMIFLNPSADPSGKGYHINQALLAIGSGGLFGMGFGRSRQKFNYLPEPATDSIFAVIAEELGLIRASLFILLYLVFAVRGYRIAKNAPDVFGRLVAVGITTWIIAQAFINIMAIMSLIPLTGVPLPFISYGGSSLIMLMFASGILLNISKYSKEGEQDASTSVRRGNRGTYFARLSSHLRA